ncbi:hypothetical protein [Bradyrhizobium sp. Ash2021]|uniref:hypothetical protein n=1 Tax=Bradyrhizobium sp. Ash2021 TaxID=2954771 RepID=UPI002814A2B4|nr:hypothetical protein [Bradyrhizobium sp. Ash2021]WMT76790.1 hypothetical protein NL528_10680 [Bradyrhizobium sp. Ash2021]
MEKVENLYRTARAQNDSTNTPKQIRSRLRDSRRRRAATNRAGWPIRNRESLVAKVLSRKPCRGSLGPVRPAREYDRNAIIVAERTSGWIFSYRARPGSGAACGARAAVARPVRASRPAAHLGAIGADALGRSGWWRGRKPLPEMSHFGAEFFRMLRKSGGRH